jgi:hypothetical protein
VELDRQRTRRPAKLCAERPACEGDADPAGRSDRASDGGRGRGSAPGR